MLGRSLDYSDDLLETVMSPLHFVQVRRTFGGPAPEETARAVAASRRILESDREAWQRRRDHLADAERQLKERVQAL